MQMERTMIRAFTALTLLLLASSKFAEMAYLAFLLARSGKKPSPHAADKCANWLAL